LFEDDEAGPDESDPEGALELNMLKNVAGDETPDGSEVEEYDEET